LSFSNYWKLLILLTTGLIGIDSVMDFKGLPNGGFGDDLTSQSGIDFEADPRSLQRILENRELSPSVLKFRSSLTAVAHQTKKNKVKCSIFCVRNKWPVLSAYGNRHKWWLY